MDLSERGVSSGRHPWEVVRGEFFLRLVDAYAGSTERAVDVGAGDSWFGSQLAAERSSTSVVCWDHAYTAEDLADASPGVTRTVDQPDGEFDLILLLDVLEHLEDPVDFLEGAVRPLATPGAVVVASVPAHPRLFGPHDESLGHFRRYVPSEFVEQITVLGPVRASGPLFLSLTAPRAVEVALSRDASPQGVGNWTHGRTVTTAVTTLLRSDAAACRFIARRGWPVRGLSHWAVAQVGSR